MMETRVPDTRDKIRSSPARRARNLNERSLFRARRTPQHHYTVQAALKDLKAREGHVSERPIGISLLK